MARGTPEFLLLWRIDFTFPKVSFREVQGKAMSRSRSKSRFGYTTRFIKTFVQNVSYFVPKF